MSRVVRPDPGERAPEELAQLGGEDVERVVQEGGGGFEHSGHEFIVPWYLIELTWRVSWPFISTRVPLAPFVVCVLPV